MASVIFALAVLALMGLAWWIGTQLDSEQVSRETGGEGRLDDPGLLADPPCCDELLDELDLLEALRDLYDDEAWAPRPVEDVDVRGDRL